jgi:fibronectin type 3 domain-containing protein
VGYNVYRRGTSGTTKLNAVPVTGTSYVDSSVQPGQTYYYVTKAVSATGAESGPSNQVQITVPSP